MRDILPPAPGVRLRQPEHQRNFAPLRLSGKKTNFVTTSPVLPMMPDYPHKIFGDKRFCYCLLMEALAMDAAR
jgi:hypothetical protein